MTVLGLERKREGQTHSEKYRQRGKDRQRDVVTEGKRHRETETKRDRHKWKQFGNKH